MASLLVFSTRDLFLVDGILYFSCSNSSFLKVSSSKDFSAFLISILFSLKIEKLCDICSF